MAVPMNSVDFKTEVSPILAEVHDGVYDMAERDWAGAFDEVQGEKRAVHVEPLLFGMGAAREKPEGTPIEYDTGGELYVAQFRYKTYGLGFALTKELVEDGDHIGMGKIYSEHLAQSQVETKRIVTANVLNNAFNSSYPGPDGVSLSNASHPLRNGTFSNQLAVAATLSQTSLEQILILIGKAKDPAGKFIKLRSEKLIVSPDNVFTARVLLKSVLRAGTANNDINPTRGDLNEDPVVLQNLTSSTAWWVKTNARQGLKVYKRRSLEKSMEGDFETDSMRYKSTDRYLPGYVDPRTVYGTAGA